MKIRALRLRSFKSSPAFSEPVSSLFFRVRDRYPKAYMRGDAVIAGIAVFEVLYVAAAAGALAGPAH